MLHSHKSDNGSAEVSNSPVEIVWTNVFKFFILHTISLYGLSLTPFLSPAMWLVFASTTAWSAMGVTAGAHRLWCHRSYRAKVPLRLFLVLGNCIAGQNSIYVWTRDHRTHHKCSETDGDPHNAKRGFFFAHMGWLLQRKHPLVIKEGRTIDLSDLEEDSLVMFQHRHYVACMVVCSILLPTILPKVLWGETIGTALAIAVLRYCFTLHGTWLVNSAAHLYGFKPYDTTIGPRENLLVSGLVFGEGFHNFHHVFPHDYATSEWGYNFNPTKAFIDLMAWLGQAYARKTVSLDTVLARAERTGDVKLTYQWNKKESIVSPDTAVESTEDVTLIDQGNNKESIVSPDVMKESTEDVTFTCQGNKKESIVCPDTVRESTEDVTLTHQGNKKERTVSPDVVKESRGSVGDITLTYQGNKAKIV